MAAPAVRPTLIICSTANTSPVSRPTAVLSAERQVVATATFRFLYTAGRARFYKLAAMQENHIHSDTTFTLRSVAFQKPGRTLYNLLSLTFPAGRVTGLIWS